MKRPPQHTTPAICIALALTIAAGGCRGGDGGTGTTQVETGAETPSAEGTVPQPTQRDLAAAGMAGVSFAPNAKRVDLAMPTFSHPTRVTNPLFPIRDLHSAVLSGRVDGKRFHTETTLLPETRIIEWPEGRYVETLVSQYVAYLDGRIQEVAIDYYAQADDGAVWYFGEHVTDFKDGVAVTNEGTWITSPTAQAAMIMPGDPRVGGVFRTENRPGLAVEEVTVKELEVTFDGPHGPVHDGMIGVELHSDGLREDKAFAPGYGEFRTTDGDDVEAMALAVPSDVLDGQPPTELQTLADAADALFSQVQAGEWGPAQRSVATAAVAWQAYPDDAKPPLIAVEIDRALERADQSVRKRDRTVAWLAALDLARSGLDLTLRYGSVPEVDLGRFRTWLRQVLVDTAAGDAGSTAGDITVLELIRARFPHVLESHQLVSIDTQLGELRAAAVEDDPSAVAEASRGLLETMSSIEPRP